MSSSVDAMASPGLSLKDQIALVVKPWTESPEKPPVSVEVMVVMALASGDGPLDQLQLTVWVTDHFRWYKEIAASVICGDATPVVEAGCEDFETHMAAMLVDYRYDLPIYKQ